VLKEQFRGAFLNIVVAGTSVSPIAAGVTTAELQTIIRPNYLQDLTASTANAKFDVHFTQGGVKPLPCTFWLGTGSGEKCNNASTHVALSILCY
jgi:hypothetical protein